MNPGSGEDEPDKFSELLDWIHVDREGDARIVHLRRKLGWPFCGGKYGAPIPGNTYVCESWAILDSLVSFPWDPSVKICVRALREVLPNMRRDASPLSACVACFDIAEAEES